MIGTKAEPGTGATARSPADTYEVTEEVRLHRLRPIEGDRYPLPIVLVPSLLSKWYVFDLHPARSLAAFLRDHHYDVWIVDWGKPRKKRPTPGFETYVDDYLQSAIDDITSIADIGQVTLLGYSLGGVLSTIFSAAYPDQVHNLITLTTPIDFHRTGLTATWARYFPVNPFIDFWGNVPGWWISLNFGTITLARAPALASAFREDLKEPEGRSVVAAVGRWMADTVPVAGEMYRTLVIDCYKRNLLIRQGLPIGGRVINLSDIRAALLTITASDDPLCPPESAEPLNRAVSSTDETTLTVPGSHLTAVIGREAHHLLWTRVVDWLDSRSGHHPEVDRG